ncbi:hypothetical protein LC55x_4575 [Lysobacter capsici]|nr:hypothetical protein LC55x_4575 [Lysobacter capsici]
MRTDHDQIIRLHAPGPTIGWRHCAKRVVTASSYRPRRRASRVESGSLCPHDE